jgi:tRNA (guanine37-N1)-methyltransferase
MPSIFINLFKKTFTYLPMEKGSFDVFGNIAIVKFQDNVKAKDKLIFARNLLKTNKSVKTILEKVGKFHGRLRKQTTKYLAGEKTKETLYRENGCVFRFNIDDTYFSSRLSNERKEVAAKIKNGDKVMVMFAGVSPYSIVIAKLSKAGIVYSNELNKKANDYAKLNIDLNKLKSKVILVPGDIKRVAEKLSKEKMKFDVIVMPRPQLNDSFLKQAFLLSKKRTRVYYYDFYKAEEMESVRDKILAEAKRAKKKVKILSIKKAGEISPYKYRIRVDFVVL